MLKVGWAGADGFLTVRERERHDLTVVHSIPYLFTFGINPVYKYRYSII